MLWLIENQDKNAHSSHKQPRGSKSVHSEFDNSSEDGFKPSKNREEE